MKLSAKNFQPWEEFSLALGKLTVLVGDSDTGKSAAVRALQGLIRNEIEADQIRVGEEDTEVTLEIGGHKITIKRSVGDSNKYLIDGKLLKRGALEIPDEVKALNMGIIEIGDTKLDPIFSNQHDSKFMLQDVGPTQMNAILGAFSSTEKLEMGKRETNTRIQQKGSEAKSIATEINEAETRKHKLTEIQTNVTPIMEGLVLLESEAKGFETLNFLYQESAVSLDKFNSLRQLISNITAPPLDEVANLQSLITWLEKSAIIKKRDTLLGQAITRLSTVRDMWSELLALYRMIAQLDSTAVLLRSKKASGEHISDAVDSVISNTDNGLEEIKDIRALVGYLRQAASLMSSVGSCQQRLQSAINVLEENEEEEAELRKTIEEERRLKDSVTCPKCGASFCIHEV
jgi:energy-coupling factor transporter ATP-binding protein EcfA2